MTEKRKAGDRDRRVALGVVVACLVYAGSLALQRQLPAIRTFLAIDLGDGARPTYYTRVVLSLACAVLVGALEVLAGRSISRELSEAFLASVTGALVGLAALLVIAFP